MEHKGYTGIPFIDEESESLYGHVIGLRDVITFQGNSFAELTQSFRDSVDDYLEFCESLGRSPEKPFSGRLLLRIPPELHRMLSIAAEASGMSLNSLILGKIRSLPDELVHLKSSGRSEESEAGQPRRPKRRILSPELLDRSSKLTGKSKARKKTAKER
jgi:predicted HicB family RNase H-like nuclease